MGSAFSTLSPLGSPGNQLYHRPFGDTIDEEVVI